MRWLARKAIMKKTLLALAVSLAALTWSRSGVAQGPCLIERGLDPLDVVNTSVRHNVWVLLDTSGSMFASFNAAGESRLTVAKRVLNRAMDDFVDAAGNPLFNWGFVDFAANDVRDLPGACTGQFVPGCAGLDIGALITPPPCGGDNRPEIRARIGGLSPSGFTPNGVSEDQLSSEIVSRGFVGNLLPQQKNFIIHVTDGEDTCECGNPVWTPTPAPPFIASVDIPSQVRGGTVNFNFTRDAASDTDRRAINAGTKGRLAYERLNPTDADRAAALKGDVFVIGMALQDPLPELLHHLAWEGSGAGFGRQGRPAFPADNEAELVKSLGDALGEIGIPPSTITLSSPVVGTVKELIRESNPEVTIEDIETSTTARAANRNNILLNATVELPAFKGHLTARKVFNVLEEVGPAGEPITVKRPDFSLMWDAGLELQNRDPDERTIFFNRRGETVLRPFRVGGVTPAELGVQQGYLSTVDGTGALTDADAAEMVVQVIRGHRLSVDPGTGKLYRADGSINFSKTEEDGTPTWKLFDATHAGPTLVLNPPRAPGDDPPTAFPDRYADFFRDRFNRQTVVYLPTNGGVMHAFRADNGAELYAYIPDDVMGLGPTEIAGSHGTLKDLVQLLVARRNGITNHVFLLVGPVSVEDVFLQTEQDWRTVIALGRGRGGKFFTALDVSDIGDWDGAITNKNPIPETGPRVPRLLFNVGNRDGVNDGDYDGLGETWSAPALGHVGKDTDPQAVLLAGSGYGCENTTEGRFFYVLRLEDGSILRRFGPIPSAPGATVQNSLVASPSAYNPHAFDPQKLNPRDRITRTFIGDLQGNVWKLDSFDENPSNWAFAVFFSLGINQPITAGAGLLADRFNQDQVFVFVGTGGDQRVNAQFVMAGIVDPGPDGAVSTGVPIQLATGGDFIVDEPPEERVFVTPATAPTDNGKGGVFFATSRRIFTTNTCTVSFTSTLFGFQATTGLGAFDADPDTGEGGQSQIDLGEGKVTGLYHRDEHLYVSKSGGIGVDAATQVIGEDTFPSQFLTSGIQVLVDSFRLSPF